MAPRASRRSGDASMDFADIVAGGPSRVHLLGGHAEDEDVLPADMLADLDVGAVEGADGERAVERELHVAGARRLHAGRRDLLGQVGGRDDPLGTADIVVGQEDDLQQAADRRSLFTRAATSWISLMISLARW